MGLPGRYGQRCGQSTGYMRPFGLCGTWIGPEMPGVRVQTGRRTAHRMLQALPGSVELSACRMLVGRNLERLVRPSALVYAPQ